MHSLKKGQINFMVELFIGSVIILLIVASSFYFAEKSNITANVDVYAENTESNCYITLNTIMQSDQFLDGKTSTQLSDRYNIPEKLVKITDELQIMMPTSRFSLTLFNECKDFRGVCDKAGTSKISEASTIEFSAEENFERCNYPIPIACDPEEYVENLGETKCKIFIEMRLNY